MKTLTAAITLLTLCMLTTNAQAQQVVKGQWQVEKVRSTETPEGTKLTFTFADEGKATLTSTAKGQAPQSWTYSYAVEGNKLTLKTTTVPGKPDPMTFEMRFEDGKMMLLEPLPEVGEGETPPEDIREPIWVLKRNNG